MSRRVHFERDADGNLPNHLTFLMFDDFIVDDQTSQPNKWPSPRREEPWVITADTLEGLAEAIDAMKSGSFEFEPSPDSIEILEVQLEGRKRMVTAAFLNGFTLDTDEALG